ncbi:MAG: peptidylprolyl isomerase [Moraxellaceae bacterium]|nr:peptidylprolyl isomerase [Moraxellaceae bacterium]
MRFSVRILSFLLLLLPLWGQAAALDRIVAVVNNEVITQLELNGRVATVTAQLRRQGTPLPSQQQLQRQVLERMITERLQLQTAREQGVRIEDGELDRAVQRIADSNKLSLADLRKAVQSEGVAWNSFREDIRSEITTARLREREVDSRVTVSDSEVDSFLAADAAAGPGREYLVSHILLRAPEGARPEQWARLQQRAGEIVRLIQQGDDFAKLAASFSEAPDGMQGGAFDWRPLERLPALFADVVVRMKPGQVSDPLRSATGLHFVKLVNVREAATRTEQIQQTRARHILLRSADGMNEAEARRRLNELRERVVNGGDFAELARNFSSDLTAAKGGDLGWLSPGDTVPDFERGMDALQPNEVSPPVQSPFGWHLIQVLERRTVDVTEDRRRARARNALRERKADEVYEDWLRQLRDRSYVELRLDQPS